MTDYNPVDGSSLTPTRILVSHELKDWLKQIKNRQINSMTTERKLSITEREKERRARCLAINSCSRLERAVTLNNASNLISLKKYASLKSPATIINNIESHNEMLKESEANTQRASNIRSIVRQTSSSISPSIVLNKSSMPSTVQVLLSSSSSSSTLIAIADESSEVTLRKIEEVESILDEEMRNNEHSLLLEGGLTSLQNTDEINATLDNIMDEEFKIEPIDNIEIEVKFRAYETFLGTVVTLRESLLEYWSANQLIFPDNIREKCQRDIVSIDNNDCLSIIDDPRTWFVYSMLVKAKQNSNSMSNILKQFQFRLQQVHTEPGDCPVCLEIIENNSADICTILSCCHKVHKNCWINFTTYQRNFNKPIICPLCRNDEFINNLDVDEDDEE